MEEQMTREMCLEITLNTLRDQMKDGGNDLFVAVIDNALQGNFMTIGMTASVITNYHFEDIHAKCEGLIATYGKIEELAIRFEMTHIHVKDWADFLEENKACDWEVYVSNWVEEVFINQ